MDLFVEYVKKICESYSDIGFEGVVVLDSSGEKIFEKRWTENYPRDIYSNTKSFVGAAVGMAVYQKQLSLDTYVIDLLNPNKDVSDYWHKLKLVDLLTMSSGFSKAHLMYFDRRRGVGADNYAEYMFSQKIVYEPGTRYLYSTGDAVLAGLMVEQAVEKSLYKFLYDHLFKPLKIEYPIWESDLSGHVCGGSGLHLNLVDMTKLGCVYLNNGKMNNNVFFDEDWCKLSFTEYFNLQGKENESYGFFWKICNQRQFYKASGAFGQDTLVFPKQNVVLGYQCKEGTDTVRLKNILRKELIEKL